MVLQMESEKHGVSGSRFRNLGIRHKQREVGSLVERFILDMGAAYRRLIMLD